MRNFGEELAYWYLRLNGFFLIDDFVLHRADLEQEELEYVQNADADIIGIRNPFTFEKIGEATVEDICPKLREFEPNIKAKTVVVISEVKAGDYKPIKILLDRKDRLRYIVKRTGLVESKEVEGVVNHLFENKECNVSDKIIILKIIFAQTEIDVENFYC